MILTVPLRQIRPRVMMAAAGEADRSSSAQIELEHVLVGLLLSGGPAAAGMAGAGLDAARIRRVVDQLRVEDLLYVGVEAVSPPRRPLNAYGAGESLQPSLRVRRVFEQAADRNGDGEAALLRELVAEPGGDVKRILHLCDIDVEAVINNIERGSASELPSPRTRSRQARAAAFIPASQTDIQAMMVSSNQRTLWDSSVVAVEHSTDGTTTLLKGGTRKPYLLTSGATRSENEVAWIEAAVGPNAGSTAYRASFEAADTGTHVTLTSEVDLPKPWLWLFIAPAARAVLRLRLQGLASALSERVR